MSLGFSYSVTSEELNNRFVVSNPLDLSQIVAFSTYRSCAGHDFRGPVASTGKFEDTPRSMKHYVKVLPELHGQNGVVKALAPFDGKIYDVDDDAGGPGDQAIWLAPNTKSPRQWQFIFFHIDLDDSLKKGSEIKAGQLIGTANMTRGQSEGTDNFDIAVKFMRPMHRPAVDEPFAHMASNVLAEYAKYGITQTNVVIPKEKRDARPCPTISKPEWASGDDAYFPAQWSADDIIWLKTK